MFLEVDEVECLEVDIYFDDVVCFLYFFGIIGLLKGVMFMYKSFVISVV